MFYFITLKKELEIQPQFLGPRLREEIERRLRAEVEGTCDGRYGFVLLVTQLQDLGPGVIRDGSGGAVYDVSYSAITFMPHTGEVIDTRVTTVNKMGFFAEAGPMQIFVSHYLIPEDWEFSTAHEACYTSPTGDQKVVAGCDVRLRIIGTRENATEINAIGDIKGEYLGVLM